MSDYVRSKFSRLIKDLQECDASIDSFHAGGGKLLKTQMLSHSYQRSTLQSTFYQTLKQSQLEKKSKN
jgi:hypothetical protein